MKDEALSLALDALKTCQIDGDGWSGPHYWFDGEKVGKAIAAIKQALAQPEPEPVAWKEADEVKCPVCNDKGFPWPKCGHITYLERIPPKPEPLTDVQIATLYWGATGQSLRPQDNALAHKFARAIEAAHGIKGEA